MSTTLLLNDQAHTPQPGESILQMAQRVGVSIPHLCAKEGLRPDGNCRACVVEIDGERTLAASCCRAAEPGLVVRSNSPRALASQRMVLELLLADRPAQGHAWVAGQAEQPHGELSQWSAALGVSVRPALAALAQAGPAAD